MSFMWGIVGINDIHCHLLLEESKGQGVQTFGLPNVGFLNVKGLTFSL